MKVRFSRRALNDLQHIGDYIAADNPARAVSFINELELAARRLAELPRTYPVVHMSRRGEIRGKSYGNYLILYAIVDESILIQHILHSARNVERLFL